ncbi:MAG: HD domain-containing phosphohydrolase [Gemmatimonadaceae bacterium]
MPTPQSSFTVHRGGQPRETRILIVDDEETIRVALGKFFKSRGYEVEAADAGALAIERLRAEVNVKPFMLMLCDVRMPGMNGLEILPAALGIDPDLAILMLTAVNDAPTATEALTLGAYDYLMKPIELPALHQAVERALHKRELQIEQRNVERMIRDEVAQRTEELETEKLALRTLTVSIAETLINAMEAKDLYLKGHSQRVAEMAASIADSLGLDEDTVEAVRLAGKLADVGKIGIREEVLNKPDKLTAEELEHIRSHVHIGMEILVPLRHLGEVLEYVHDHHEHVNGKGYPRGLSRDQISLGGRILCACDAYDALTSKRAYRGAMTPEETLEHLGKHIGTMFDDRVYEALCSLVKQKRTLVFIEN